MMHANEHPLPMPRSWREQAACRGVDPAVFFPGRGDWQGQRDAKAYCDVCPVRVECLNEALADSVFEDFGIRGGLSERARRNLRTPAPGIGRPRKAGASRSLLGVTE